MEGVLGGGANIRTREGVNRGNDREYYWRVDRERLEQRRGVSKGNGGGISARAVEGRQVREPNPGRKRVRRWGQAPEHRADSLTKLLEGVFTRGGHQDSGGASAGGTGEKLLSELLEAVR